MASHHDISNFIWAIADLLRGPYRPPQYERVMLPMTVLRRFDCVLAPTKDKVLREHEKRKGGKLNDDALDKFLNKAAGQRFHNHSPLTFEKLKGDPDHIDKHLTSYINGFSGNVRRIFEYFEFTNEIEKMREANVLFLVVSKFCDVDLHPDNLDNIEMGLLFEYLIRRFNELANETAGDHFTPREVVRLMVNLLFIDDDKLLATPGTVRKLLDPACGTGGMLAEAQNYLREHHPQAKLFAYGQDYNKRAFAVAASDMLIKQVDHNGTGENIRFGDSFTDDQFQGETFDYLLANPPFGVDWKKQATVIEAEHKKGFAGRFRVGLPRVNDGSLLFLQHMISKFEEVKPEQHKHGSRLAIVFNGSPLFTGGAGSGESDIRKWIIEKDWLEAIVALPEQMFYNTGILTYLWIVTNRKPKDRKGKIQLVDAREIYIPMRRSQGDKRRKIGEGKDGEPDQIADIVRLFGHFEQNERSKVFDNAEFGYTRVTVERPLRLRLELSADAESQWLKAVEAAHAKDKDRMAAPDKLKSWFAGVLTAIGRNPWLDGVEQRVDRHVKALRGLGKDAEREFRRFFVVKDPAAKPVIKDSWLAELPPDYDWDQERNNGTFHDEDGGAEFMTYEADPDLRDFENVPLKEDIDAYFRREVLPHVPDAWMDRSKDKVGYEINFNRHFYRYTPPRPLEAIDADLKKAEEEIMRLLKEVTA
jgi:type I restriction enzyme M protein